MKYFWYFGYKNKQTMSDWMSELCLEHVFSLSQTRECYGRCDQARVRKECREFLSIMNAYLLGLSGSEKFIKSQ